MTLADCIAALSARLDSAGVSFGHGTARAYDEAAWLVLWRLGLPLDSLAEHAARTLAPAEFEACAALIDERIASRRPAAYLTGEAWLQGVPFFVDERVIVPRSLIAEVLASDGIEPFLGAAPARVLDLCTGSGCLAVLAALAWPDAQVDAADISAGALEVARANLDRHRLASRIRLLQGDGFAAVDARRYDLIVCNPPYVNAGAMAALPAEYRAEPAIALAGGEGGMDFVRPLLERAAAHLEPGAALVLEIGHEREHFERAFPRLDAVWLPTSAGDEQVLLLTRDALAAPR